jgi:hypothetical protein
MGPIAWRRRKRPGLSGLVAGLFVFLMLFTIGSGYFVFVNSVNTTYVKALSTRASEMQDQLLEDLQLSTYEKGSVLMISIANVGPLDANITDVMIVDPGKALHSFGLGFAGNTVPALAMPLASGSNASLSSGLTIVSGVYTIKVITARGNVFATTYPPPGSEITGGNALFIQMIASPPQVLGGASVTDTVTVSNYAEYPVANVTLVPTPPTPSVTGTASLTGPNCTPASFASIPAFNGTGDPSSVTFTCTWTAHTGTTGGLASFAGAAQATLNGVSITSPSVASNVIQIGGTPNVLNQGPFSINAFFFKYSSCTQAPSGYRPPFHYSTSCTTDPTSMPPASLANLPQGSLISGGSNYYVAFYVQLTNNFNSTLAITEYSYIFLDPTNGGESSYYIVGSATNPQVPYYPNYASNPAHDFIPYLTPYTSSQLTCAESPPDYTPPPPTTCIDLSPGQTDTLTFAACGFGASNWSWGGTQYAQQFDNDNGCSTVPPAFETPEGTYMSMIISYVYNGVDYTEAIPFQGQIVTN